MQMAAQTISRHRAPYVAHINDPVPEKAKAWYGAHTTVAAYLSTPGWICSAGR